MENSRISLPFKIMKERFVMANAYLIRRNTNITGGWKQVIDKMKIKLLQYKTHCQNAVKIFPIKNIKLCWSILVLLFFPMHLHHVT